MSETDRQRSSSKKQSDSPAIVAGFVALASCSGLLSWFGIFSGEHADRGNTPPSAPATRQFIDKDTGEKVLELDREWKFQTGDDPAWSATDFDDSSWDSMPVPAAWDAYGYAGYDGFAWYRTHFSIEPDDTSKALYLYLGRVDDVDEVHINGVRIGGRGRMPPDYLTGWNQNRIYRIDTGILKSGEENVLSVRVFDEKLGGGIVSGPVGIYASALPQPTIDLSGEWQFRKGDNRNWAKAGDAGFSSIQVPLVWEAGGFEEYDGFAWYQKRFTTPPHLTEGTLALVLGRIDDSDQVYLNGTLIGSTGELDGKDRERNSAFWRMDRVYEFPISLLRDENLLSVRVHDSGGNGGIYSGPVGIMTPEAVRQSREIREKVRKGRWEKLVDWLLGTDRE